MSDTFTVWKSGVLSQIGAPDNATNTDTLWAWSSAEGGIGHNNPLNTTFYMPGATPWNTLSGNLHVWIYASITDGITATVSTLLNGDYPLIVSHFQNSEPRQQWSDACGELGTWGTGCGWISNNYGAAPGAEVEMLDASDPIVIGIQNGIKSTYDEVENVKGGVVSAYNELVALKAELDALKAQVAALPVPPAPVVTATVSGTFTGTVNP